MVGATRRKTPISLSALDKNPMLGHLFEGNPVDEGEGQGGLHAAVPEVAKSPTRLGD